MRATFWKQRWLHARVEVLDAPELSTVLQGFVFSHCLQTQAKPPMLPHGAPCLWSGRRSHSHNPGRLSDPLDG